MSLTKEQILAKKIVAPKLIHIAEWDEDVYIRHLSGSERDDLELEAVDKRTMEPSINTMIGYRAKCAAYFLSDEHGNRLFPDPNDWRQLRDLDGGAIHRISVEGRKLNGMTVEVIEQLEKNSLGEMNGDIGSA